MYTQDQCVKAIIEVNEMCDGYLSSVFYAENKTTGKHPSIPAICNHHNTWKEAKEAANLEAASFGERPEHTGKDVNVDYFKEIDNKEKAYWLGFIYGDGWVTKNDVFGLALKHSDDSHIHEFSDAIESEHTIRKRDNGNTSINVGVKEFVYNLKDKGIDQDKTFNSRLPELDDYLWPHFVRGLFDADGHQGTHNQGKRASISGSPERFKEIQRIIGFVSSIRDYDYCSNGSIIFYGEDAVKFTDWMYPEGEETEPKLDRKYPAWLC